MKYECISDEGILVAVIHVDGNQVEIQSDKEDLVALSKRPAELRSERDGADIVIEVKPGEDGYVDAFLDSLRLLGYDVVEWEEAYKTLTQRVNERTGKEEWALISKKDPSKILEWFGIEKPSDERVAKAEARISAFKHKGDKILK